MKAFSSLLFMLTSVAATLPLWKGTQSGPQPALTKLLPMASAVISERHLAEAPLGARDQVFAKSFPGTIARYRDESFELLLRSVSDATRYLHPSSDCFRGLGYKIGPLPSDKDSAGNMWGCFSASRGTERLHVCEHIEAAGGGHWSDVSHWFWSATFGPGSGPWTAMTSIRRE